MSHQVAMSRFSLIAQIVAAVAKEKEYLLFEAGAQDMMLQHYTLIPTRQDLSSIDELVQLIKYKLETGLGNEITITEGHIVFRVGERWIFQIDPTTSLDLLLFKPLCLQIA